MKNNLIKKRLSKTHFVGHILARLPHVRCVILNGSMASGKARESSDIDILIIAKKGRIFTARFFVNFFATLFRIKRSKDGSKNHSGKFCFNYFLTENFLKIPIGRGEEIDKYCAENYSASKFVAGDISLYEKFLIENKELFEKYDCYPEVLLSHPKLAIRLHSCPELVERVSGSLKNKLILSSRAKRSEVERSSEKSIIRRFRIDSTSSPQVLVGMTGLFGNYFEKWAKNYQIKKIESDPRTKKYPSLIVYNDQELRFHPPSLELRG